MSNKKNKRSTRQTRAPIWLSDHVVNTASQKLKKKTNDTNNDEIRANNTESHEEVREENEELSCEDNNSGNKTGNKLNDKADYSVMEHEVFPTLSEANKQLNVNSVEMSEPSLMKANDHSGEVNNVKFDANVNNKNEARIWNNKKNWNDLTDDFEKKLSLIPTAIEDGRDVVLFDDEMVNEGSAKWNLNLCGQFVGTKMTYSELKYNLSRMWGRFGLKDIVAHNGLYFFKFRNIEGVNQVLENGIWLVNNRPLVVQMWNPSINIVNTEPEVLPVWVKLYNVPLEAWTVKGVSAITSSLGKPIMMDRTTARMCHMGTGSIGYARVLVEVKADKELKNKIEIVYKGKDLGTSWTKFVNVEYTWKPLRCDHCKVFGHCDNKCTILKDKNTECEVNGDSGKDNVVNDKVVNENEEFARVNRNKKDTTGMGHKKGPVQTRGKEHVWQKKAKQNDDKGADKGKVSEHNTISPSRMWKASKETMDELKKSANKYAVFCDIGDNEVLDEQVLSDKEIVDKYVNNHRQPGLEEEPRWTPEMYLYFKEQWELRCNNEFNEVVEEVQKMNDGMANIMNMGDVRGMDKEVLHDC